MLEKLEELEKKLAEQHERRAAFLKDATPLQVLERLMRHPDTPSDVCAYCAKALLPYLHPKKDAIEPEAANK